MTRAKPIRTPVERAFDRMEISILCACDDLCDELVAVRKELESGTPKT